MRLPLLLALTLPAPLLWAYSLKSGTEVLSELNDCIQQRFLNTGVFGMARILPFHGIRQFRAENSKEQAVLQELEQDHYDVALFLAGRRILDRAETPHSPQFVDPRSTVQGPAYITRLPAPEDLPKVDALLADARAALASFDHGQGYTVEKSGWTVMIRPLRATSDSCIRCHTTGSGGANATLKIGDALGAVLYVYRGPKEITESAVNLR